MIYHQRVSARLSMRHAVGEQLDPAEMREGSTRALAEALQRRGEPGEIQPVDVGRGYFRVRYKILRPGRVSIIIPTKDQADALELCLRSLFTRTDATQFEVLLVENNSVEPKTFELLADYEKRHGDRFRVLKMPTPFNFSRLMNAAVREARGDYILLLNNDTEILHRDWLAAMIEQAQRPSIGCVGAKLLYPDLTIQHAGVVLGRGFGCAGHIFSRAHRDASGHDHALQRVANYSAVTAACLMVRKRVYEEVGGFDESFAVDYNDVDFCLRVRRAGYHNVLLPHVRLLHYESLTRGHPLATSPGYQRHRRETQLMFERWRHVIDHDPCVSPHLTAAERDLQIRAEPPRSETRQEAKHETRRAA